MTVSSRTPEGQPASCPLCMADVIVEPSVFFGDVTCPRCGQLLWFIQSSDELHVFDRQRTSDARDRVTAVAERLGADRAKIANERLFRGEVALRRSNPRMRAVVVLVCYGLSCLPFIQVGLLLAAQPGDERAMLMFFLPPAFAALFVIADNGRFEPTFVRGAWLLLIVNAIVSALAEFDILPILPQFAGVLPAPMDRVFVLYLAGWYSFVLVVCPGWFLCRRVAVIRRTRGHIGWWFIGGWLSYAGLLGTIILAAGRKLF